MPITRKQKIAEIMSTHIDDLIEVYNFLADGGNRSGTMKLLDEMIKKNEKEVQAMQQKEDVNMIKKFIYDQMMAYPKNSELNRLYYEAYQKTKETDDVANIYLIVQDTISSAAEIATVSDNIEAGMRNARKKHKLKHVSASRLKDMLDKHELWLSHEPEGEQANFTSYDLSYIDFEGRNLTGAILNYADLTGANLSWTIMQEIDATLVNFKSAKLIGVDFRNSSFSSCDFSEANFNALTTDNTVISTSVISPSSCKAIHITNTSFEGSEMNDLFSTILLKEGYNFNFQ